MRQPTTLIAELVNGHYPVSCRPGQVSFWRDGKAFSGAKIWIVATEQGTFALRRWPRGFEDREHLEWIQAVLRFAADRNVDFLSIPMESNDGRASVQVDGYLWQLCPWLAGKSDFHDRPSAARLSNAARALAQFTQAVTDFPAATFGVPAAVSERLASLESWTPAQQGMWEDRIDKPPRQSLKPVARRYLRQFAATVPQVLHEMRRVGHYKTALVPCIRDVWHAHVLFSGDEVTGIVDYGAMRIDTPATCLSRLLSSLAGDDSAGWRRGFTAYQQVRHLSEVEIQLVRTLDLASTLLTGLNWLRWIFLERRSFDDELHVAQRLELAAARLDRLVTGNHVWHQLVSGKSSLLR